MSSMKLTKNSFTINEMKLVDDFNLLCNDLKRFKSLRAKTIFMYERTTYNFEKLKKFLLVIKDIYNKKLKDGFDESEIKDFIPDENTSFMQNFIDEHERFSKRMHGILNINTLYYKYTIKERADKYIRKINPFLHQNGLIKTLEEIVYKDKFSLHVLNNDYFDNLVYYTLVVDNPRLRNSTFNYQDYFDIANISMGYDNLIKRVYKYSNFQTPIEINEETLALANEARYINNIKPDDFLDRLKKDKLTLDEVKEIYEEYKNYFKERKKQDEEEKNNQELKELEDNLAKNVEIVKCYVNNKTVSLDRYLAAKKMKYDRFMKSVDILKENNHPVYDEFLEKLKKSDALIDLEMFLNYLKKGIVVNGKKVRDFDLVDYYGITYYLPLEAKQIAHNKVSGDDYIIINDFYRKYKKDMYIAAKGKSDLLKMTYSIKDDDGEEYKPTEKDKRKALLYLDKMGIPITQCTYKIMVKRIIMYNMKQEKEYQKNIGTR